VTLCLCLVLIGNLLRSAMIDAATSAEVALTAGLNTPLSAEAFPRAAKALVDGAAVCLWRR
jgi:hypothetical protein